MKIRPRKNLSPLILPTKEELEAAELFATASYHCKGAKGTIVHKTHCKEMLNLVIQTKLTSITDYEGKQSNKYQYWEKVKSIIEKI